MSNLDMLRGRVDDLRTSFGRFDQAQRDRQTRLNDALDSIQDAFRAKQVELEEAKDELGRLRYENEELRELLLSLLKSIEGSNRAGIESEIRQLDVKIKSLVEQVKSEVKVVEIPAASYFEEHAAASASSLAKSSAPSTVPGAISASDESATQTANLVYTRDAASSESDESEAGKGDDTDSEEPAIRAGTDSDAAAYFVGADDEEEDDVQPLPAKAGTAKAQQDALKDTYGSVVDSPAESAPGDSALESIMKRARGRARSA